MAIQGWLRALDTLGALAAVSSRVMASRAKARDAAGEGGAETPGDERAAGATTAAPEHAARRSGPMDLDTSDPIGQLGQIEARLAGVVVAALKEAFDRDRARLDLERSHLDAERERAERALRLERTRQAGDRALSELRLVGGAALVVWIVSAVLAVATGGAGGTLAVSLTGVGWLGLLAALCCAVVAHGEILAWLASTDEEPSELPRGRAADAAPWLLAAGVAGVAIGLLIGL